MHFWVGLYMWENRYRQFKDKRWDRTCGKRGTNQKVGPYMWENVPPFFNCGQVLKFGAPSRYYKGALTQKR